MLVSERILDQTLEPSIHNDVLGATTVRSPFGGDHESGMNRLSNRWLNGRLSFVLSKNDMQTPGKWTGALGLARFSLRFDRPWHNATQI